MWRASSRSGDASYITAVRIYLSCFYLYNHVTGGDKRDDDDTHESTDTRRLNIST